MEIKLKCPTCNGRGSVALPEHLSNVLNSIRRGKQTSEEIYADLHEKITRNAIGNRLADLRSFGLVKCRRRGRFLYYSIAKGK